MLGLVLGLGLRLIRREGRNNYVDVHRRGLQEMSWYLSAVTDNSPRLWECPAVTRGLPLILEHRIKMSTDDIQVTTPWVMQPICQFGVSRVETVVSLHNCIRTVKITVGSLRICNWLLVISFDCLLYNGWEGVGLSTSYCRKWHLQFPWQPVHYLLWLLWNWIT